MTTAAPSAASLLVGYLLLLSVKHFAGTGPIRDTDQNWAELLWLATDYAAVLDVQGYTPSIWGSMDALALLPYLQETALYDTLFCLPQIRGSDVEKIARGVLRDYDFDKQHGSGWSLNDALASWWSCLRSLWRSAALSASMSAASQPYARPC